MAEQVWAARRVSSCRLTIRCAGAKSSSGFPAIADEVGFDRSRRAEQRALAEQYAESQNLGELAFIVNATDDQRQSEVRQVPADICGRDVPSRRRQPLEEHWSVEFCKRKSCRTQTLEVKFEVCH